MSKKEEQRLGEKISRLHAKLAKLKEKRREKEKSKTPQNIHINLDGNQAQELIESLFGGTIIRDKDETCQ